MPKAPKPDPEIKRQQERQKQAEMQRLSEEKKKQLTADRRVARSPLAGARSLISGESGSGFIQ